MSEYFVHHNSSWKSPPAPHPSTDGRPCLCHTVPDNIHGTSRRESPWPRRRARRAAAAEDRAVRRRRNSRQGTSSVRKDPTAGYFSFSRSRDLIYSTYSISTLEEQSFPFSSRMSMPPPYIAIGAFLCMRIFLSSDPARTCMIRSASFGQWLRSSTSLG